MIRVVTTLFLLTFLLRDSAQARRGNPIANTDPKSQFYIIDSDDDHASKPVYSFRDTTFGTWIRIGGFPDTDTGNVRVFSSAPILFSFYDRGITLPPSYIHINGMMTFDSVAPGSLFDSLFRRLGKLENGLLPRSAFSMLCPLWTDLELRRTGDSSKIFYRMTSDSCIVSFYNMGLKGANGKVLATFQVVFATADSSITIHYKSFDGNMDGEPAAAIFQRLCTIGVQDTLGRYATNYLDRNTYYAFSRASNPSLYEQNLHNGLAVKFRRAVTNYVTLREIVAPPFDGYELTNPSFQPGIRLANNTDTIQRVLIFNEIFNTVGGARVYSRLDTLFIAADTEVTHYMTAALLSCGSYRMTSTITTPSLGTDPWTHDNVMTREFVRLSELALPHLEDFKQLDLCKYNARGVTLSVRAENVMRDPAAPFLTGAIVIDRKNSKGTYYTGAAVGDTLTTSFINLLGKSNVWLIFSYQRGLSTDSTFAGIRSRTLVGPEVLRPGSTNIVDGDSLIVEALQSGGTTWNPSAASWVAIGKLYGGIDLETKKFRVLVPSAYIHNHSRFRIRLAANDNGSKVGFPFDDADAFVIDALQIAAPTSGKETDLEPTGLDLGAKYYTHIPRDVKFITPKVKIASNGLQASLAVYQVRLVLRDQLGREVYHQRKSLVAPAPRTDVELTMPSFPIEGSQGGVFSAKVTIEQMFSDYYRANDTNTFFRKLLIDDVYAYDDGTPDTVGSMTAAHNAWYFYTFRPLRTDSLRGMDFYHLAATGLTNWVITFRDPSGNVRYTRSLTYDVLERGFKRALFSAPVPLSADSTYVIQCNMTQGFALGGDASLGLAIQDNQSNISAHYWILHPDALADFSDNVSGVYGSPTFVKNGAAGGPLLPMMRLVYRGSATYLPVELLSLRAQRMASGEVNIQFLTASESDVSDFAIERSVNGNSWEHITTLPAENALHGASYATTDADAPRSEVLYRLIAHDLDGSSQIIGTVAAGPSATEATGLRIRPNPAADNIQLLLPAVEPGMRGVIYDEAGRTVTTFTLNSADQRVDIGDLSQGIYFVEVIVGADRYRTKLWVAW